LSYLQSLPVFLAVVEEGSFSAAAKKLRLTQPTVSFHIDNLEKDFNCQLFTRTTKGVLLTTYGETLYQNTYKIHDVIRETQNQIQAMVAGNAGHITIGASTIPAEYILPTLLADFLGQHAGVKLSLKTGDSGTILGAFREGLFPIAIVGSKPDCDLCSHPLWTDELVLVAHPDVFLSLPAEPQTTDIFNLPFVIREATSGTRNSFFNTLAEHGITLEQRSIILEVGGSESLKSAVLNKVGIGFISRWAVQRELADDRLRVIPLPGFKVERQFYAVCRPPLLPTCVQLFWDFLIEKRILKL
jgi:DNA-binding transcriptional LysR family regulator